MGRKKTRNYGEWTKADVKRTTRTKLQQIKLNSREKLKTINGVIEYLIEISNKYFKQKNKK